MYYLFESDEGPFLVEETNEAAARSIAATVDLEAELIDEYLTLQEADWNIGEELDVY